MRVNAQNNDVTTCVLFAFKYIWSFQKLFIVQYAKFQSPVQSKTFPIRLKLNTCMCATIMRNYDVIAFMEICIDFLNAATRKLCKYAPLQSCMPWRHHVCIFSNDDSTKSYRATFFYFKNTFKNQYVIDKLVKLACEV